MPATGSPKKPRFIKPANTFKQKVGSGGIPPALIEKAQEFIEKPNTDYIPYAQDYLKQLNTCLKSVAGSNDNTEKKKETIIRPVMQIKASGGMFNYQLMSDVADIALQFLENIEEINADTLDVLRAHENTLQVIMKNNLTGDGGKEGYALVVELDKACKRYFSRHKTPE